MKWPPWPCSPCSGATPSVLEKLLVAPSAADAGAVASALADARYFEHQEFTVAMQGRVGAAERATSQLEAAVVASQGRAAEAMRKLSSEARRAHVAESECGRLTVALDESDERAAEAIVRVAELEQDNVGLRSELETQTSWQQAHVRHA